MSSDSRKTYAQKLLDPRWQQKRLRIMDRDKFACVRCQCNTKTLHVHHKSYRLGADPWDYDDDSLETLCEDCHASEHGKATIEPAIATNETALRRKIYDLPPLEVEVIGLLLFDRERGELDATQVIDDDFTNETCKAIFAVVFDAKTLDEAKQRLQVNGLRIECDEIIEREEKRRPFLTMSPSGRFDDAVKQFRERRSERSRRELIKELERRKLSIEKEAELLDLLFEQERNRWGITSGGSS